MNSRVHGIGLGTLFLLAASSCGTTDSSAGSQVGGNQVPENGTTQVRKRPETPPSDKRLQIEGCSPGQGVHLKWIGAPTGLLKLFVGDESGVFDIIASSVEVHVDQTKSPSVVIHSGWIQGPDGNRHYFDAINLFDGSETSATGQSRD